MEYAAGLIIAVAVGLYGTLTGLDRERSFYSTVVVVVATYYLLFAAMAGSPDAFLAEGLPVAVFATAAALGFRGRPWIVVAALALHGVFDMFHHAVISNPGVPAWWPGFCLSFDVAAAAYLASLLVVRRPTPAA